MDEPLGRFPLSLEIPVAWGDMDAFQHVNNTVFLRWLESARIDYFGRLGMLRSKEEEGVGPILARVELDYLRPVTFPDGVRVETTVSRIGRSSFTMDHRVHSRAQAAEVARASSVIVVLDYRAGRSTAVDARLRAAIHALEGGAAARP